MTPFPIHPRMDAQVDPNLRLKDLLRSLKELDLSNDGQRAVCRKRASQSVHLCGQIHPNSVTKVLLSTEKSGSLIEYLQQFQEPPYSPNDIAMICSASRTLETILNGGL